MIRTAGKADIPRLAKIFKQLHKRHCDLRCSYYKMPTDDFFAEALEKKLADQNCRITVLEQNSSIAAYALWYLLEKNSPDLQPYKKCYIDQFAVHSDFRRQGLGKKLMAHLLGAARLGHCNSAELSVWCDNSEAVAFYEALGFTQRTANLELRLK